MSEEQEKLVDFNLNNKPIHPHDDEEDEEGEYDQEDEDGQEDEESQVDEEGQDDREGREPIQQQETSLFGQVNHNTVNNNN